VSLALVAFNLALEANDLLKMQNSVSFALLKLGEADIQS
jgi:hypothetical protein